MYILSIVSLVFCSFLLAPHFLAWIWTSFAIIYISKMNAGQKYHLTTSPPPLYSFSLGPHTTPPSSPPSERFSRTPNKFSPAGRFADLLLSLVLKWMGRITPQIGRLFTALAAGVLAVALVVVVHLACSGGYLLRLSTGLALRIG